MVRYVCSECGHKFRQAAALVKFEAKLVISLVPTGNGVAVGVESSPRMDLGKVEIGQVKCPECGYVVSDTPRYIVDCGHCGVVLCETTNLRDAAERFCRDTHLIHCNECWQTMTSRFCEVCRYASTCTSLQVNRR